MHNKPPPAYPVFRKGAVGLAMMGGPMNGRMFGGLNNISQGLLKNLGGMSGNGGLGALGSLLGGGMGGLGNLAGMMGGNNNLGGLGGLGNLVGMMNNMSGSHNRNANSANNLDINSILGALGGNGGNNGGLDLNAILNQLNNMQNMQNTQQQAAPTEPPPPEAADEPIHDAQYTPTNEPNSGFNEERFQDPASGQQGKQANTRQQNPANNGPPNLNPELLQMLNNFLGGQAKQQQAGHGRQQQKGRQQSPGAAGPQNAYRQSGAKDAGNANRQAQQSQGASSSTEPAAPRPCDICFDCPLNCPRAGLKLPAYAQVRRLAQGWQRF